MQDEVLWTDRQTDTHLRASFPGKPG